ncbi:MAG: hypothetical protein LQ340_003785 [Diploschistes diacapsis]|nr:MAG: hypothetical protein LQ340_003785 [Diploschistes diacapsis]
MLLFDTIGETCEYSQSGYKDRCNSTNTSEPLPNHEIQQEKRTTEPPSTSTSFADFIEAVEPAAPPSSFLLGSGTGSDSGFDETENTAKSRVLSVYAVSYIERLGGIAPGPQLLETDDEALKNLAFISSVVRIAQSMGLHQECAYSRLDPLIHEMHRRIRGTLFVSITNTPFIRLANVLQNGGQPMGYAKAELGLLPSYYQKPHGNVNTLVNRMPT